MNEWLRNKFILWFKSSFEMMDKKIKNPDKGH